jgi:hypothetical protein
MCRLLALVICGVLVAPWPTGAEACGWAATPAMIEVDGAMEWYRDRPEREQEFRGTLRRREVVAGPMARAALRYTLDTDAGPLPVYAPEPDRLEPYVGHEVVARAKLVDLTAEGFGPELWIGSIAPAGDAKPGGQATPEG